MHLSRAIPPYITLPFPPSPAGKPSAGDANAVQAHGLDVSPALSLWHGEEKEACTAVQATSEEEEELLAFNQWNTITLLFYIIEGCRARPLRMQNY